MSTSRQRIDRLFEDAPSLASGAGCCTYHAFWRGKKIELKANTSYEAQKKAAASGACASAHGTSARRSSRASNV